MISLLSAEYVVFLLETTFLLPPFLFLVVQPFHLQRPLTKCVPKLQPPPPPQNCETLDHECKEIYVILLPFTHIWQNVHLL